MIVNILGVLVVGGLVIALMCVNAVEGYEDDGGFHRGRKPS